MENKFHLSLPCLDIQDTKEFYKANLEVNLGRFSENWLDIDLFGHQVTFTKAGNFDFNNPNYVFEGKILPSFHFGIIISKDKWQALYEKLSEKNLDIVTQALFLKGKPGEHLSFFVQDPNGYVIEFKSFKETNEVFVR